jgi:hypothetical protein
MDNEEERPKSTKSLLQNPFCKLGSEEEQAHEHAIIFSFNLHFFWLNKILLWFLK